MRLVPKVIGLCVGAALIIAPVKWGRRHLNWYALVDNATLTANGSVDRSVRLFRSTRAFFSLPPDRTMVLIQRVNREKRAYLILGPGPGHFAEGFKGRVWRCDSAVLETSFFAFAIDNLECVAPIVNLDDRRQATFAPKFVEFTDDDGKRLKVAW